MTTFDRFERDIPELMRDLAPSRVPDYFDDMLQRTTRTRQRPAWSALERWLPMGVIARTRPMSTPPWRMLAVGIALLLLIAAAVLYVGSSRPLPAPFGPAANGQILFHSSTGDILSADPATGRTTTRIASPETDWDPWFSNDGTKFAFDRGISGHRALFIANSDGSEARQLLEPAATIDGFDWSPDGRRIYLSRDDEPVGLVRIVDATTGSSTTFTVEMDVRTGTWRPGHDQLLLTGVVDTASGPTQGFYLVNADGTGLEPIVVSPIAVNQPALSPDGSSLAYSTWTDGAEGRTHIIDIDSGRERPLDIAPDLDYTDLNPMFAPDGRSLLLERYDISGYRPTIVPLDGQGPAIPMGSHHPAMTGGASVTFSPDGSKVLATYQDDGTTWLLDTATGGAEQMDWAIPKEASATWQRLAP